MSLRICCGHLARLVSSVNWDVWGKWHRGRKQLGAILGRAEQVSNLPLPVGWFLCCFHVSLELSTKGAFTPKLIIGFFGYEGKGRRPQQLSCLHPVLLVICLHGGIWYSKALLGHSFCLLMTDHGCPVFWLVVGYVDRCCNDSFGNILLCWLFKQEIHLLVFAHVKCLF